MKLRQRPRRLRGNEVLRKMVRETRISRESLVYPMFVMDGADKVEEIASLPGQYRYTVDRMGEEISRLESVGINKVMLFGIPEVKDEIGSQAYAQDGVIQRALEYLKEEHPYMYRITDVCMCEYTSHGHCGVLKDNDVDNDETLKLLARTAVSHVKAGAQMVAPSDMMDGRIAAIREALDEEGFAEVPIMSYSVKYASAFYGPFRDAAGSAPAFGNRKSYQMDYHNRREALKEAMLDVSEGADIIMVKPAMSYLDLVREIHDNTNIPIAAYSVSGEYAMVKAAAQRGWINETEVVYEMAASAFRAGADIYITYYAKEIAEYLKGEWIG